MTNLAGGGAEKAMLKIADALAAAGHQVHIVLLEQSGAYAAPGHLPVHCVCDGKISKGFLGRRLAAWRLRRMIERLGGGEAFDLIVSTLPFADEVTHLAGLAGHWCRIANTLSAELAKLAQASPAKAQRRRQRYRRLYEGHPLVAVSRGVADDLRQQLGLASPIVTIPNPFDPQQIRALAGEIVDLPAAPYVLHVGRFAPQKRHDLLLDAWQRISLPHKLVLLTEPEPRLTAMIAERGLADRVLIAGFRRNPYPWFARAALLVLCSDHEGLPNVLLEALACGTPVLSTDCPSGPAEILAALPQCLVPCGDAAILADRLEALVRCPPEVANFDLTPYAPATVAAAWANLAAAGASGGH